MSTVPTMDFGKPLSRLVIVIDMQNDFVTGSLGSKDAQAIVGDMVDYLKKEQSPILFTLDTHGKDYLSSYEGRHLPVAHCISGEKGHDLIPELLPFAQKGNQLEKPTFGSLTLQSFVKDHPSLKEVVLMGVCTDICVVSNALLVRASRPDMDIKVIARLCAGTSKDAHQAALAVMRSNQIEVV